MKEKNKKTGVIGSGAVSGKYHADVCKSVGERGDEEAAANSCSAMDCTGLIPSPPASEAERESYEEVYHYQPKATPKQ